MIVYAAKTKTYIWSDNNSTHKAGSVPLHEPLIVTSDSNPSWYAIERPVGLSMMEDPMYPDYWVKKGDTVMLVIDEPAPAPSPTFGLITDEGLAVAIITILKWLKQ